MTRRRILVLVAAGLASLTVLAVALLHSGFVQRPLFRMIAERLESDTGWRVEVDDPRLRLWPARLVATGITVSSGGRTVAAVDRVEARWGWSALMGSPRRLDELVVEGLELDLRELPPFEPPEPAADEPPFDPWHAVEVGRLRITDGWAAAAAMGVEAVFYGVRAEADLTGGRAKVALEAADSTLDRLERRLHLGSVSLRLSAAADGVVVETLRCSGDDLDLDAHGRLSLIEDGSSAAELEVRTDVARALGWWDPNLVTGLDLAGELDLAASVSMTPEAGLEAEAVHRGGRLRIAGYELDELELGFHRGVPEIRVSGSSWGRAAVAVDAAGLARVSGRLDDAPVEDLLAFVAPQVAAVLSGPVRVSGDVDGTVAFPFNLEALSGRANLVVVARHGRLAFEVEGAGEDWSVTETRLDVAGASITASGEIRSGGRLDAGVEVRVDDVAAIASMLEPWIGDHASLDLGGGPVTGTATLTGTFADPRYRAELEWESPSVMGRDLAGVAAAANGDFASAEWSVALDVEPGIEAGAEGILDLRTMQVDGFWRLEVDSLTRAQGLTGDASEIELDLQGSVRADGRFVWAGDRWTVSGEVDGRDIGSGEWTAERIRAVFDLDPTRISVSKLTADLFGSALVGSAEVGLTGVDAAIAIEVAVGDLDLRRVPTDLGAAGEGSVSGALRAAGTLARPTGVVSLGWTPHDPATFLPALTMEGSLDAGVFRAVTEEVSTRVGSLLISVVAPLGLLPRPPWLWPDAPPEPLRVSITGREWDSRPLVEALGWEALPVNAHGELDIEAHWHPTDQTQTTVLAEINDLVFRHVGGEIAAQGPLTIAVSNGRVKVEPLVLKGPNTLIELEGAGDLDGGPLDARVNATLAPEIARLIPYPIQIYRPIRVSAIVGGNVAAPRLSVSVDHTGGVLVMRDPPLQVRDLVLEANLVDGVFQITDGRAELNRGLVEIGGGWDPVSGQGMVAELAGVVFFVDGILTQWDGTLAIEPDTDRLARVVGELNLVAGLWDQNVNLAGAVFGPQTLDLATDDPLQLVALDLTVRGRGNVRVENNLGRFDARWDTLRVSGTAAQPRIVGEILLAPGGRIAVGGQGIKIRRGSLRFTGDPAVDPIAEIVPESDIGILGDEAGRRSTAALATQGLVQGLAGALGFENETLQPAEISIETEKDTAEHFMIGQRVSHNVALFFATSTSEVQDRTSMLQFWNLPWLKGLAVQAYEKTLTEEIGGNIIQRFRWGGTSAVEDRPTIRKLKLEGEWPISKRRLKKATGFRRAQPYDPFLLFVAQVRMERELAGEGFQEARVETSVVGEDNARTLVFTVDPGPRQTVEFVGDQPPRRLRREVTVLYQPPPLERIGFKNMHSLLDRHFNAEGFSDAAITVERRDDLVVVEVVRGLELELSGPVLTGAPPDIAERVRRRFGSPAELAALADDDGRAARAVERVLVDQGFHQARVLAVDKVPVGDRGVEVRVDVDPGPRALVGAVELTGADPLELVLAEDFALRVGEFLDRLVLDIATSQLRAGYDAAGYSDAEVRGSISQREDQTWVVTINLEPGIQRTFSGVEISGLNHVSRRSILAGVTLEEGEILRNSDIDATAVRVANFAPIERVDVRTVPDGSSSAKVEFEIQEKPRWTTEVGGGWSSERGAQARFGLRDDNLLGRGFGLNLRGRWDQTEWLGFVVASLPPLPGKRLSFSSTIGYSRGEAPQRPETLAQDEAYWSIQSTHWFGDGQQVTGYYRYSTTHTYEKEPDPDVPVNIDVTTDVGLLGARYVVDRFDYPFDPKSGYGFAADIGYGDEILGSDLYYWTALGTGTVALPLFGSNTWVQSLRVGVAEALDDTNLHTDAKFFAGGQGSIRGFDRDTVGPVIRSRDGFTPAGGGALLVLNEELRIPVWGNLRAAVFADVGQVWPSWSNANVHLSVGAGVGIRWATPVGPLWADVAWPVVNTGISSTKPKFYVGIGRPF